jgi:diguanylate cyclase (GGDEF)-like protein/PAS domain S-box-containing protein
LQIADLDGRSGAVPPPDAATTDVDIMVIRRAPDVATPAPFHVPLDVGAALLLALPKAVLVMVDRRIVFANPAAFELFGVADLAELVEREAARAHVLIEDVKRIETRLAAIERGETVSPSAEYRILRPDGTTRVVEWSTLPITFADRPALLCSVNDVTTLALARDALRISDRRQRDVIATLSEGVIAVDRFGVCTDANPSAAQMLGLADAEQLIGVHADVMPLVDARGDRLARALHPVWRALERNEHIHSEVFSILFPDGIRRMRVSTVPIVGRAGAAGGAVVTFDDVTTQLEEQERTARSEERFRKLAGVAPVAVFEMDSAGVCTYVNAQWCAFIGSDADHTIGTAWTAAIHPDDLARVEDAWCRSTSTSQQFKTECRFVHRDGTETHVSCAAVAITDDTGHLTGWIGTATDLSAELCLRQELRASEARFRLLVEQSPDTVVRILLNPWRVAYISPSIVDVTGCTREEFYRDPSLLAGFIHPDDLARVTDVFRAASHAEQLEYRLIHRDGSVRTIDLRSKTVVTDGVPTAVEATLRDITRRVAEHDVMSELALRDDLTGLANRRAIIAALDSRLAARQPTTVIFLDLDHFKAVNDTHGHDAGDEVLKAVAQRLTSALRDHDVVGRLGGDEFVVISDPGVAPLLTRRLVNALAATIELARGPLVTISASVGTSTFDPNGARDTSDELLHRADSAMYGNKAAARR